VTADVLAFTITFGVLATFVVAGFALLFTELRRIEAKLETEIRGLRRDLAEEFRAQRTEVLAQTTALANAITAARS
jgi:hypothetical protein